MMENLTLNKNQKRGMMFDKIVCLFYREHAKLKGFSVFKRSIVKKGGGVLKCVMLSCDKGCY